MKIIRDCTLLRRQKAIRRVVWRQPAGMDFKFQISNLRSQCTGKLTHAARRIGFTLIELPLAEAEPRLRRSLCTRTTLTNRQAENLRGITRNQPLVVQKAQRGPSGRNQNPLCHVLCLSVHLFAVVADTSALNPPDFGRTMGAERSEAFALRFIVLPSSFCHFPGQ